MELLAVNTEDIMENPQLQSTMVSFQCLTVLEEIGHGIFSFLVFS